MCIYGGFANLQTTFQLVRLNEKNRMSRMRIGEKWIFRDIISYYKFSKCVMFSYFVEILCSVLYFVFKFFVFLTTP